MYYNFDQNQTAQNKGKPNKHVLLRFLIAYIVKIACENKHLS